MIEFNAIPIFDSNYVWAIVNNTSDEVYIVDPGLAAPVLDVIASRSWALRGILVTHSHADHIGGINDIKSHWNVPVYGPKTARIPQVTHVVNEAQKLNFWETLCVEVVAVPGHVPEHIAYFIQSKDINQPALFCGDAVFSSGCGRMFEGTPEQFHESLEKVRSLPDETEVYCAHEYTQANLDFADYIEPDNVALHTKRKDVAQRLSQVGRSLPSSIAIERETNPFLRCHIAQVQQRVGALTGVRPKDSTSTFAALRRLKDNF